MSDREERVLILAPLGRDAELARRALCRVGMKAYVCATIDEVCRELTHGAGALLLTQEALSVQSIELLLAALSHQQPWSDLPLVALVSQGSGVSLQLANQLGQRVNATFLERPVGEAILVRAAATAIRVRRRQYELRDHLRALAQAQEAERQARAFAEEAVRIRDEFLSSVAHDLKNPLGAIKGFVQLVQRQLRRGDALDRTRLMEHLDRIDSMITRTTLQIDELLDLARLQADQPLPLSLGPVDLVALAQRVAGWHATSVSHRIQVEARADELVGVWDGHRLERVLSNLLENALKYSPAGGVVSVWVTQEEDWAVLTVEDEGMGIPQEDLPHVFERFYRAANAAHLSGTGLGLAGARQITEQHGGAITIASVQGQGTRVTLRLPMVSGGQAERAPGTG